MNRLIETTDTEEPINEQTERTAVDGSSEQTNGPKNGNGLPDSFQNQDPGKHSIVHKTPFYYGWVITAVGMLGLVMTSPGQTYAVSIFIERIITDLGISRSLVSTLYTVATLAGSLALPFIGRWIDVKGPRFMMVTISLLLGLACIYMGFVQGAIMLIFGFLTIRMFGQASLTLVVQNTINQWWDRRRGRMMGFAGLSKAILGMGGFPLLINFLIPELGWRYTFGVLGLIVLFVMVPAALMFVRNRPENFGLKPDGDTSGSDDTQNQKSTLESRHQYTRGEAIKTPAFWILALGVATIAMLLTAVTFHIVSIFKDQGLNSTVAATTYVPIAVATALFNFTSGFLVEHLRIKYLMASSLFAMATALILTNFLTGTYMAILMGAILGSSAGLMSTVNGVGWAHYYGRLYLGSITGITSTILIAGSSLGPLPFGFARDLTGSYNTVIWLSAIWPLVLGIATLFIKRPPKEPKT